MSTKRGAKERTSSSGKRKTTSLSPKRAAGSRSTKTSSASKKSKATPTKSSRSKRTGTSPAPKRRKATEEEEEDVDMEDEEDDDEDDVDMEEEDHEGLSIKGVASSIQSHLPDRKSLGHLRDSATSELGSIRQTVSDEVSHYLPAASHALDSVTSVARQAYAKIRHSWEGAVGGTATEEDEKGNRRHSGRQATRASTIASKALAKGSSTAKHVAREAKDAIEHAVEQIPISAAKLKTKARHYIEGEEDEKKGRGRKEGIELRTQQTNISHLLPYHPTGTVVNSWPDVFQLQPHLLLQAALIIALHVLTAAVRQETFRGRIYEYIYPRSVRNYIWPRETHHWVFTLMDHFSLLYPLLVSAFFISTYFLTHSIRSVLLRQMSVSQKEIEYHAGNFSALYSRMMYSIVHMAFIIIWWWGFVHSQNILDLNIIYWINLGFWAQDALCNAVYRWHSATNFQTFFSYFMLWLSLVFAFIVHTPTPSIFTSYDALIKPGCVVLVLILVFVNGLISASGFIKAHGDFSEWLKPASWAFLFVVFVPIVLACVIVPALSSFADIIEQHLHPILSNIPHPHRTGSPPKGS